MNRLVIRAGHTERQYWSDLWHYRELFYVLAWRDVSVKYKQTALGIVWALIQPILATAIFTFLGSKLAKLPSDGIPYALLVMCGTLPWQFFAASIAASSQSLVTNANLVSKVYFPRVIVPAAATITALVDFLIAFVLLLILMAWYHVMPTWRFVALPFLLALAFLTALGPGLLITALNVKYRDFRYIIPFCIQIGAYIAPTFFLSSVIAAKSQSLYHSQLLYDAYSLNPMVGVIDGFRWALLGGRGGLTLESFGISLAVTAFFLVVGIHYFRKTEETFADII
jgi:lipopolysaccharide transport system permease protein